jgi:hypothetical protein
MLYFCKSKLQTISIALVSGDQEWVIVTHLLQTCYGSHAVIVIKVRFLMHPFFPKHHIVSGELATYWVGQATMQRGLLFAVVARSRRHKIHCKALEKENMMRFLMHPAILSITLLPVSWFHRFQDKVQRREIQCLRLSISRSRKMHCKEPEQK